MGTIEVRKVVPGPMQPAWEEYKTLTMTVNNGDIDYERDQK